MSELPEVEAIKQILEPQVRGREITEIVVYRPEVLAYPTQDVFQSMVIGTAFTGMGRRGKYLLFQLSNQSTLTLHLRMTGQILVTPPDFPEQKHTHVIFKLDNGDELRFIDTRCFGRFWLISANEKDAVTGIHKLGLEPFDTGFNADYLMQAFGKRKKAIKECLLDQTVIAGIGNIYGDEILYTSKIHPGCPANSLTYKEWCILAETISTVLQSIIEKNRMTPDEYLAGLGNISRELADNGRYLKSLYENLVSGLITPEEYARMKADYGAKIEALSDRADEIRSQRREAETKKAEYGGIAGAVSAAVRDGDLSAQIVDCLIDKILVRQDKSFEIVFRFDIERKGVRISA